LPGQERADERSRAGRLPRREPLRRQGLSPARCSSRRGRSGGGNDAIGLLPGAAKDGLGVVGAPADASADDAAELRVLAEPLVLGVQSSHLLGDLIEEDVDLPLVVAAKRLAKLLL